MTGMNAGNTSRRIAMAVGLVLACSAIAPATALAGTILLPPGGSLYQVQFFEPIGQSFTAEDPFVQAGLSFEPIDPGSPNDAIRYDLYAGNGTTGTLLNSQMFTLADGFIGFHMADFSSVPLTIGSIYTLTALVVGDSSYWGLRDSETDYAGGNAIRRGDPDGGEMALMVIPDSTPVPEPASILLLGTGAAALLGRARLRRRSSPQ